MSLQSAHTSRLIVKNLPKNYSEAMMKMHFANSGTFEIKDCKIVRKSDKTKQFGFIEFADQ